MLSAAFERLGTAQSGLLFADLLTRAGPILADQGFPTVAVSFLERALGVFWNYEQPEEEIRTALSLGTHYLHLGRHEPALQTLTRCLHHPSATPQQRANAVSNLAWLHERQQRPDQAVTLIDGLGFEATEQPSQLSANLKWIKARALSQKGELYAAAGLFATLEDRVARFCAPVDPILLFCDYASVLIRLGDRRQLSAAAESVQRHLGRLHDAPMLAALAAEALEETLGGLNDVATVDRLRREIASATKQS